MGEFSVSTILEDGDARECECNCTWSELMQRQIVLIFDVFGCILWSYVIVEYRRPFVGLHTDLSI